MINYTISDCTKEEIEDFLQLPFSENINLYILNSNFFETPFFELHVPKHIFLIFENCYFDELKIESTNIEFFNCALRILTTVTKNLVDISHSSVEKLYFDKVKTLRATNSVIEEIEAVKVNNFEAFSSFVTFNKNPKINKKHCVRSCIDFLN